METITIKDIARLAGVGVSTVSRALNNHPDINAETRNRVMEIVEQYGFVPNGSARSLKISESRTIAVLVKGMTNPFFMKMIGIMENQIHERHYSMELRHVDERTDGVDVALELVKEKKLSGIIFLGGLATNNPEKLERLGIPFVLSTVSTGEEEEKGYSSVCVDDVAESYKMVQYLIEKGHRKIALMGTPECDTSIGELRMQGYLAALKDNNIESDESLIWHADGDADTYSMKNGYNIMKKVLKEKRDFSAVFAISDTLAMGAMRALREAGRRVPEDVSVAGFDGIDMGLYCVPSITTIAQPFEEMAKKTTNILFDDIDNKLSHHKVVLDADLKERESVKAI